jgi:hypothetical protein
MEEIMSKNNLLYKLLALVVSVAVIAGLAVFAFGAGSSAGTSSDPLVTLSYVNETFKKELLDEVQKRIDLNQYDVDSQIAALAESFSSSVAASSGYAEQTPYMTVEISAGNTLDLPAGSEFLVLSGNGKVSVNMAVDTTSGKNLSHSDAISENHFIVCPADCQIQASSAMRILVK